MALILINALCYFEERLSKKTAITPTRVENYSEWYQAVIQAAEMAEMSGIRGCMILRPWGYGIWQELQRLLDAEIRRTGHENVYFPLFIPLSYIEKEAAHVEGFAREMAVVTHHRLEQKDGRLLPASPLHEPLVVRPTSETIIGASMAKWINSWRDLPLLLNQWANVVRWEMRPRIFLRTTEFLWQEGHTAHADRADAERETRQMLDVYRNFLQDELAIPVLSGAKPASERFPGAVDTLCVEAMMQDGKALQAGTSHYLGDNFARAAGIRFTARDGEKQYVHTTSWGVTSRLIGALIMVHGDDNGLRIPPRVAPRHIVIVTASNDDAALNAYADELCQHLCAVRFDAQRQVVCNIDRRDLRMGEKNWSWIKKGVPIIVNLGKRELASRTVSISRRDCEPQEKTSLASDAFIAQIKALLAAIQKNYFNQASNFLIQHTRRDINARADFEQAFRDGVSPYPFLHVKWCENEQCQAQAEKLAVTIRCIPFAQSDTSGHCVICGKETKLDVVFAKSY